MNNPQDGPNDMQMDDDALEVVRIIKHIKDHPTEPANKSYYHLVGVLSWGVYQSTIKGVIFEYGVECPIDYIDRWSQRNPGRIIWPDP